MFGMLDLYWSNLTFTHSLLKWDINFWTSVFSSAADLSLRLSRQSLLICVSLSFMFILKILKRQTTCLLTHRTCLRYFTCWKTQVCLQSDRNSIGLFPALSKTLSFITSVLLWNYERNLTFYWDPYETYYFLFTHVESIGNAENSPYSHSYITFYKHILGKGVYNCGGHCITTHNAV